jgi:hypothetical protein
MKEKIMDSSKIGLQEQLDKIDTQIFALADKYDFQSLDNVVRGWVALSGFEKDQQNYANLADLYNFKSV